MEAFSLASNLQHEQFFPTTLPIEPPIKLKSIQATTKSLPLDFPTAVRTASLSFVFSCAAFRRSIYFFLSVNFRGSLEVTFLSSSLNLLSSNKRLKYSLLPIRTWYPSSGLTKKLRSNSSVSMIFPVGDLYHKPFGVSRFASVGV